MARWDFMGVVMNALAGRRSRSTITAILVTLLLLSFLPALPPAKARAQEAQAADAAEAEIPPYSGEAVDARTLAEEAFPDTKPISRQDALALNDPFSRTTENPDGTLTKEIFFDPVNWRDENGEWHEIDNAVAEEEAEGYRFANSSNAFKLRLPGASGEGKTCSLEVEGKKLRLHLAGHGRREFKGSKKGDKQEVKEGRPATLEETPELEAPSRLGCVTEGNQARFRDAKRGYSLEFTIYNSSIEMVIKLESPSSPNVFNFKLDTEGMDLKKDEAGNLRALSSDDGRELFHITPPIMVDSNGASQEDAAVASPNVTMDITKDKEGKAFLTIAADPAWLADPARVYPVYIDPTWVNIYPYYSQMGSNMTNHGDTFCNSANPGTNYGNYWTIFGGYLLKCGYTYDQYIDPMAGLSKILVGADVRTFFHNLYYDDPDGTKYNASAIIGQAYFDIYCYQSRNGQQAPIVLEYPTSDWAENSTSWNNYPTVSSGTSFNALTGQWNSIDVTAKTRSWVKGVENGGTPNRGFSLKINPSYQTLGAKFKAREETNGPRLRVSYTMIGCPYNTDEVPTRFTPGETRTCPVYIRNTGEETWKCDASDPANPYRLGFWITDRNGNNKQLESRVSLPRDIAPGEAVCLAVPVRVPSTSGDWRIHFGMVKEASYWFRDKGVNNATVDITVGNAPADAERDSSSQIAIPWMSHASIGGFSVNLTNGATTSTAPDLSVLGRGVPFSLTRTYASNTVERDPAPLFGPNFFSRLDVKIKDYGNGYLAYYDAGGRSYLLTQARKPDLYVPPNGHIFRVEKNPDYTDPQDSDDGKNWKYKVTGTDGASQHFDGDGRLIYLEDGSRDETGNYKNKTRVAYNFDGAGNIRVTDASGRSFTVTLSGGKVVSVAEDASWAAADGHAPRSVSYEYNGPGGRLSRVALNPGDHWASLTYSGAEPNLIVQTESKIDDQTTRKAYFEYAAGKLVAYRGPRSSSPTDDTYKSTVTYNSGSTVVSSPSASNYLGMPAVRFSTKYVYNAQGETVDVFSGVNPDGTGGMGRVSYEWNARHQVTKVTDYQDLSTPLGSVTYTYDGKGNPTVVKNDLPGGEKAVSTAEYTASRSCSSNPTTVNSPDGDKVDLLYTSNDSYFKGVDKLGAESVVLRDPATENGRLSVTLPAPLPDLLTNASCEKDADSNGLADGWNAWEDLEPGSATSYQMWAASGGESAAAGRYAQRLVVQGNTNPGRMMFYQDVEVTRNTDYTLSFSYRGSSSPDQRNLVVVRQYDKNNNQIDEKTFVLHPSPGWSRSSFTFRTSNQANPELKYVRILVGAEVSQAGQDLWADFDAIQLLKGARDTAFNNVENGSCERNNGATPLDPAGWNVEAGFWPHGTDAWTTARYVSPRASLVLAAGEWASQAVNVKKNTRYLISGYVFLEGEVTNGYAMVWCDGKPLWYSTDSGYFGQLPYYSQWQVQVTQAGKWVRLAGVLDTEGRDTVNIGMSNYASGAKAYFDDISLTELPDDAATSYEAGGNYVTEIRTPLNASGYSTGYLKTDPVGNVIQARDARSSGPSDNTYLFSYTYNELSQLASVVSPLVHDAGGQPLQAYTASYGYDAAGRMLSYADNNEEETSFAYNQSSQVTAKTDPNSRTVEVEYNEAGGVKKVVYPTGWEVYYAYLKNGALGKVAFRDPQGQVTSPYTFVYDGTGRLTQVSDSQTGVTLNFAFDSASRLVGASSNYAGGFTSSYAYTKGGRLTSLTYSRSAWGNGASTTYAYRDSVELSTLTLPSGDAVNYLYEDRGRLSSISYVTDPASNNYCNSSSFTYDAAARLASITHDFYDSGMKMSYEYDAIGNVTRVVEDNREELYAYDELSRLVSWTEKTEGQVTREETYSYDGNGNIVRVNLNGTPENHAYDAANQITDAGFAYDECGNLTSDGDWVYEYDRGSRLLSARSDADNLKLVFSYDPQGRRVAKTAYERDAGGGYTVQKYARFYHYDAGGDILAETDSAGNIVSSYAYDLSGRPVAFTQDLGQGQKTFFLHANAQGDVVAISDENMHWAKRFSYDPWGNVTSETASSPEYEALSCPFAYAGYLRDRETGLYFLPARCYSPALRRFLSKDPAPGSKVNPLTLNPYQYCGNNPVNNVDPTGQAYVNLNLRITGLDTMVSQLASAAALMQAGARDMAPFASSMHSMASSLHIGRMPSFSGIFSGFTASVKAGVSLLSSVRWGGQANGLAGIGIGGGSISQRRVSTAIFSNAREKGPTSSFFNLELTGSGETARTVIEHTSAISIDLAASAIPPLAVLNVPNAISEIDHLNDLYNGGYIGAWECRIRQIGAAASLIPGAGLIIDGADALWDAGKALWNWIF